jgi:hypothetical protein
MLAWGLGAVNKETPTARRHTYEENHERTKVTAVTM